MLQFRFNLNVLAIGAPVLVWIASVLCCKRRFVYVFVAHTNVIARRTKKVGCTSVGWLKWDEFHRQTRRADMLLKKKRIDRETGGWCSTVS